MPKDEKTCPNCNGNGEIAVKGGIVVKCKMCNGSGTVPK